MSDPTPPAVPGAGELLAGHVLGLHHVAIVVPDLAAARGVYELLGLCADGEPEYVPEQRVNILVLRAGSQRIELVEPAADDSPVSAFLAKRGGGLHHLAYEVADVAAALEHCKREGLRVIDEAPRPGGHGTTVAFLHPKATGGVLVELVQA